MSSYKIATEVSALSILAAVDSRKKNNKNLKSWELKKLRASELGVYYCQNEERQSG